VKDETGFICIHRRIHGTTINIMQFISVGVCIATPTLTINRFLQLLLILNLHLFCCG